MLPSLFLRQRNIRSLDPTSCFLRWKPLSVTATSRHLTSTPSEFSSQSDLDSAPQSSSTPPPAPSSSQHSSLSTFLEYARQTSLSPESTTFIGTRYEYLCQHSLRRLGFTLTRTGGRSDAGIDLVGDWRLPSLPFPLRCIVQCKNLKAKAGPNLIRELEGAFVGAPAGWKGESVVAVLCAGREATKGVREAIRGARRGLVWIMIEDINRAGGEETEVDADIEAEGTGRIRQVLWNDRVASLGLEGIGVQTKYSAPQDGGTVDREAVLTWKGEMWEPDIGT